METTKRLYVHFVLAKELSDYDKELKTKCKETIKENCKKLTAEKIEKVVCDYFGKTSKKIRQKSRLQELVKCRQIIMYFLQTKLRWTQTNAGFYFNQDHATARAAKLKIEMLMDVYPDYKNDIVKIKIKL